MKVLVLGAGGQVGRELMALPGPKVGLGRVEADLADPTSLSAALERVAPDLVINAAAYTAVDRAESEPALAFRVNGEAPGEIARWCARRGAGLVHVSTDYVFDGAKPEAWVEDDPVAPLGVYGASKAAGEAGVIAAGGRAVIVRTSWVFGRYGQNFVRTIDRLAGERDQLKVVADQHGRPTGARPLAAALWAVGQRLDALPSRMYHFAGDPVASWFELAREVAGHRAVVAPIGTADWPTPARRPANSALDCSRWLREVGIPLPDWRSDVREILQ
jgi:dTDP-4-dehydrorhamnose reductase